MEVWGSMLPQAPNPPPPTHTHTLLLVNFTMLRRLPLFSVNQIVYVYWATYLSYLHGGFQLSIYQFVKRLSLIDEFFFLLVNDETVTKSSYQRLGTHFIAAVSRTSLKWLDVLYYILPRVTCGFLPLR